MAIRIRIKMHIKTRNTGGTSQRTQAGAFLKKHKCHRHLALWTPWKKISTTCQSICNLKSSSLKKIERRHTGSTTKSSSHAWTKKSKKWLIRTTRAGSRRSIKAARRSWCMTSPCTATLASSCFSFPLRAVTRSVWRFSDHLAQKRPIRMESLITSRTLGSNLTW